MKIRLMNSLMMPEPRLRYEPMKISKQEFVNTFQHEITYHGTKWDSSIGYPQLASLLTDLLGVRVDVVRQKTTCYPGDLLMVAKLPYRLFDPSEKKGRKHGTKISDYEFFEVRVSAVD